MSLSDCPRCWVTPCVCGYEYTRMTPEQRATVRKAIEAVDNGTYVEQPARTQPPPAEPIVSQPTPEQARIANAALKQQVLGRHARQEAFDATEDWLTGMPLGHLISLIADAQNSRPIRDEDRQAMEKWVEDYRQRKRDAARPIPALLFCPHCKGQHVDLDEWTHRPHHTHLCAYCKQTWRVEPYCVGAIGTPLDEEHRQAVLLALAELSHRRPGWTDLLGMIAERLHGRAMFEDFRALPRQDEFDGTLVIRDIATGKEHHTARTRVRQPEPGKVAFVTLPPRFTVEEDWPGSAYMIVQLDNGVSFSMGTVQPLKKGDTCGWEAER